MAQVIAPVGGGSNNGEVVTLADGGYMVVWTHLVTGLLPIPNVTDEQGTAILGRAFDADGSPRGEVFQINQSDAASGQGQPDVAVMTDGNVVVAWTDGPSLEPGSIGAVDAFARIITPAGVAVTDDIRLSVATEGDQRLPKVVADERGGFFASWSDASIVTNQSNREDFVAQRFDANGMRRGDLVQIAENTDEDVELIANGGGVFTLAGESGRTFDLGATYDWFEGTKKSTREGSGGEGNFNPFNFNDEAVGDGAGFQVAVQAFTFGPTVTFWNVTEVETNFTAGSTFADGTPTPETAFTSSKSDAAISQSSITLEYDGAFRPAGVDFTPQSQHTSAAAATLLPDGNVVVVWTAVSGGTRDLPEFSVFAATLSREGLILSDTVVIEADVQGSGLAPPFVSAGTDSKVFIGWTDTTDRNGAGTNEIFGGVYDVPSGGGQSQQVVGTPEADQITGDAASTDQALFLLDGDDVYFEGTKAEGEIFGMGGNDRFVMTSELPIYDIRPGLGLDILDLSTAPQALDLFLAVTGGNNATEQNGRGNFEGLIGTKFDDVLSSPGVQLRSDRALPSVQPFVHAEDGDDTINLRGTDFGGLLDGGHGTDTLVTGFNRDDFVLTFNGDHYTLGYLFEAFNSPEPPLVRDGYLLEMRAIEQITFADETLTLMATNTRGSGGVADGGVTVPPPVPSTPQILVGTGFSADMLAGGTAVDLLWGDGVQAAYLGDAAATTFRLYQATLGRAPDRAGQINWAEQLNTGSATLPDVTAGFVGSREFQNTYGPLEDRAFVEQLYQNVLGRAADAGGLATWTDALAGGASRAQVVNGFSESREFIADTRADAAQFTFNADPANWTDEVYRLYRATLDRDPDAGGLANWMTRLSEGTELADVIAGFVESREFQNTYNDLSDAAFVELLYQNVLGRSADAEGLQNWLDARANGASRADVVRGFSESREFVSATRADLESYMRGLGPDDTLIGLDGDDRMAGGAGADVFAFDAAHKGSDVVLDLEAWDTLVFTGFGYTSDADILAQMTQRDPDAVQFTDQGVSVLFENTVLADMTDAVLAF